MCAFAALPLAGATNLRGLAPAPAANGKNDTKAAPKADDKPKPKLEPYFLPITNELPDRVTAYDFHEALDKTWAGLKARNIDAYDVKLLHRPRSETPDDAVSEGVGYGMLLALYSNDQEYFNILLDNGEKYMWNGRFHDWRVGKWGEKTAFGAATDAEQDIALALIFAQHLQDKGVWQPHWTPQGVTYAQRAQNILDSFWNVGMIQDNKYLAPGAGWGGRDFTNPGYFAPAWYRIFKKFDSNPGHNWDAVIDQNYASLAASVGVDKGMVPDWMTPSGGYVTQGLGYNAYLDGKGFFKDAIRTHWRVANDYVWFQEPRAKDFLQKAYDWIEPLGGASYANFFTMAGDPLSKTDMWEFDGGRRQRHRFEHSHLTVGMWATTAFAVNGSAGAEPYAQELLKFYEGGDFWGATVDPTGFNEDIDHNELYFDQFMAWFGASLMAGYWVDVTQAV